MPVTAGHRVDRLRRAWALVKDGGVVRLGPTTFRVAGNREDYYDVDVAGDPMCYCADQENRGRHIEGQCKHVLAARLVMQDTALLGVIGDWLMAEVREQQSVLASAGR